MKRLVFVAVFLCVFCLGLCSAAEKGLVGWWKFDEGDGEVAKDSSGKGYDGQIAGAGWADGKFKKALLFDGNSKVEIPDADDLRLAKGISIEAWVCPAEIEGWRMIVSKQDEYQLRIDPPQEKNQFSLLIYSNGSWEPRVSNSVPALEKWSHIVGIWTGDKLQLWVNGKKKESGRKMEPGPADNPVLIGAGFIGMIDEVRIYNRALSPEEIAEHYGEKVGK